MAPGVVQGRGELGRNGGVVVSDVVQEKIEDFDPLADGFGFTIRWRWKNDSWMDFEVFEVSGLEGEGGPKLYDQKDWQRSGDVVPSINDAEPYCTGYIKWDGCAEIDFESHHFCGSRCFKKHIALMRWLYTRAYEVLDREPFDPWEE